MALVQHEQKLYGGELVKSKQVNNDGSKSFVAYEHELRVPACNANITHGQLPLMHAVIFSNRNSYNLVFKKKFLTL